jgi:putative flippase GtrA
MQDDRTLNQLFRYTFVGGLAFVVDFGVLVLMTEIAGVHYLASAAVAFMFGVLTNYTLSVVWVFRQRTLDDKRLEFAAFAAIALIGLGLNEVLIWFFTRHVHLHYLVSKLLSTVSVFSWNFFLLRFVLFRREPARV